MSEITYESVTLQDCIDMYEKKGATTIINDGVVAGFFLGEEK